MPHSSSWPAGSHLRVYIQRAGFLKASLSNTSLQNETTESSSPTSSLHPSRAIIKSHNRCFNHYHCVSYHRQSSGNNRASLTIHPHQHQPEAPEPPISRSHSPSLTSTIRPPTGPATWRDRHRPADHHDQKAMCYSSMQHSCGATVRRQSLTCSCPNKQSDSTCSISCGSCGVCAARRDAAALSSSTNAQPQPATGGQR
ncbi:hypothetical protein K402DRAFT_37739 [Aulographum hederae CBS 113979]|uniref:Uncharacterized protein n=1 Tax=Aulographum hederae CBS 113979 TaxID=1176131 RepID=A0A6G1H4M8_9PEZI|nr:hypothetical protein K402DRAFT_37739 [Aulographum hederae CBS 113979]